MSDFFHTTDDDADDAVSLCMEGRFEEAVPLLNRIVGFDPSDHGAFELLIDAHMGLNRFQRVLDLVDRGIADGRPRASLLVWKSVALGALERWTEAEDVAREALNEESDHDGAAFALSVALEAQDRLEDALDVCQVFNATHPKQEGISERIVVLASELDRFDLVVNAAREHLRRFGANGAVMNRLGLALTDLGQHRKAERAFRDATAADPENVDYHVSLIMAIHLNKGQDAADKLIDRLTDRNPELAEVVAATLDRIFEEFEAAQAAGLTELPRE